MKFIREDEALPVAAGKRAESDEFVIQQYAGSMLRRAIESIPTFTDGWTHIPVKDLATRFSNYLYLPRLKDPKVLERAIGDGLRSMMWELDTFAYADSWDETAGRYRDIRTGLGQDIQVNMHGSAVLVHPSVAKKQFAEETGPGTGGGPGIVGPGDGEGETWTGGNGRTDSKLARRYFELVKLNPQTMASQVTEISKEVVSHLSSIYGADVTISLEIQASVPDGVPDKTRETVEGRAKDLGFDQSDFVEN